MAKTKLEKIAGIEEEIRQLKAQQKRLLQQQKEQERKARTKRLIERGAILESLMDGADALTNEQLKTVLTAALGSDAALETLVSAQEPQGAAPAAEPDKAQGTRA